MATRQDCWLFILGPTTRSKLRCLLHLQTTLPSLATVPALVGSEAKAPAISPQRRSTTSRSCAGNVPLLPGGSAPSPWPTRPPHVESTTRASRRSSSCCGVRVRSGRLSPGARPGERTRHDRDAAATRISYQLRFGWGDPWLHGVPHFC